MVTEYTIKDIDRYIACPRKYFSWLVDEHGIG